jgi:hypothetical protein
MTARLSDRRLGNLRWLVVAGNRVEAFHALGAHMSTKIAAVLSDVPNFAAMERYAATSAGNAHVTEISRLTAEAYSEQVAELRAMADGAGVSFEQLLLLNLRGDLGDLAAGGCTDLIWRGRRTVLAHNEDGARALADHCALLSLHLDEEPAVTAWWYPGFLPSNAFVLTSRDLAWGINHLPVSGPAPAPGRHFLARELQKSANLSVALNFLRGHPTAGGFTYNFAESPTGLGATVEAAYGQSAESHVKSGQGIWHTNHTRYLAVDTDPAVTVSSRQRAHVLERLDMNGETPSLDWFCSLLTQPPPLGVRQESMSVTLCSFIADLSAGELVVIPRGNPPVTARIDDLLRGRIRADCSS